MMAIEEQKLLACVYCRLCLEACPTNIAPFESHLEPAATPASKRMATFSGAASLE
jgi:formate hydrogenlyase subunit 6/NADH:ubiquinone oxidoreductase subunit I